MPSMVFGVFLRAIYTFKTLNCTVAYGLWATFGILGAMAPLPPPKSAYGNGARYRHYNELLIGTCVLLKRVISLE